MLEQVGSVEGQTVTGAGSSPSMHHAAGDDWRPLSQKRKIPTDKLFFVANDKEHVR